MDGSRFILLVGYMKGGEKVKWYRDRLFPYLMKINIGKPAILEYRRRLLKNAKGNILEIGIGAGTNLTVYPKEISSITAVDPYIRELPKSNISVTLLPESAEKMSFKDNTFDTVVSTFCFCSTNNLAIALKEIYRILRPGGRLLFLEHGKATNKSCQTLQKIFNPLYNIFAYGCNITRSYTEEMKRAGFHIVECEVYKAKVYPRMLVGYLYEGIAEKQEEG